MLDKTVAINKLKLIINRVHGCMLSREIFENALYDCFENVYDIATLLAGYDYFALLIKRPKFESAVSAVLKNSVLSREYARFICEIWIEAKFTGFTEQDIAATVVADEFDSQSMTFEDENTSFDGQQNGETKQKRSLTSRRSVQATTKPTTVQATTNLRGQSQQSQSLRGVKPAKVQLQGNSERRIPASAFYKKISGRDTIVDNCYSTFEKIGLILLVIVGFFIPIIISYYALDESFFWTRSIVALALYFVLIVSYYMFYLRNKSVKVPFRWTVVTAVCSALCLLLSYILLDILVKVYIPGKEFLKYILFGWLFFVCIVNYLVPKNNGDVRLKRMVYATAYGFLCVPFLLAYYFLLTKLNLNFTIANNVSSFWLVLIYCAAYFPFFILQSLFHGGKSIKFSLLINVIYTLLAIYIQFICYIALRYTLSIDWYYSIAYGIVIMIAISLIFRLLLRKKYLHFILLYLGLVTVSIFLGGAIFSLLMLIFKSTTGGVIISLCITLAINIGTMIVGKIVYKKIRVTKNSYRIKLTKN